ncbi:MAG: hypothetical protein ACRDRO_07145, partial [Pseudonocardiaceae bacterium]
DTPPNSPEPAITNPANNPTHTMITTTYPRSWNSALYQFHAADPEDATGHRRSMASAGSLGVPRGDLHLDLSAAQGELADHGILLRSGRTQHRARGRTGVAEPNCGHDQHRRPPRRGHQGPTGTTIVIRCRLAEQAPR